ncbi:aldehyde dehydrogenase family protein [Bosea sp. (in: a-proteobacteria)]|uniref:aldehyde dehydrogenase family protein n=1 Tax=Bosea sp. (in: a-proteobacteria) TaxID=1871050 RepID=UPI002DDCB902|nr:aldehyde dehydrogenase family protein [Bosea sp. (in: a-proteobacteria)]HEV2508429.1 aldehyde dehydrogenase family protein [Bosea sp. (in: a-proteobacteria)]
MSSNYTKFYIDGAWVEPLAPNRFDVINPATEETAGQVSLGSAADVDAAVKAARRAFETFAMTTKAERLDLLASIIAAFEKRFDDLAEVITAEMGSPLWFAKQVQTNTTLDHFKEAHRVLKSYDFGHMLSDTTRILREPIGVCGFITPWNWPINQIASKFAPALAAGCTAVVKPSEIAPLSAILLTEVIHAAGVPKGVFNLVNGDGPTVGEAISSHPDIDMVSFTGSTRAGILVAKSAAETVKRVHQELGGKSANIIVPGADLAKAIPAGVLRSFTNTGQSCQAPTRMLVHRDQLEEVLEIAKKTAEGVVVGDPLADGTRLGPLVSKAQFDRVQHLIGVGINEGARVVIGGQGRPPGLNRGYYVRPTIFADVTPEMTLAQQEIFGPVLSILSYKDEDDAVAIANGTVYGLAGYVWAGSLEKAREIGGRLRAGRIYLNGAPHDKLQDVEAPFGGYKQSGNGREAGIYGLEDFLEIKAMIGYEAA